MRLKKFKFKKVNSTNNTAIRIIKNSDFKFGMVTADTQLSGKGQYGKKWISNKGNLFVRRSSRVEHDDVAMRARCAAQHVSNHLRVFGWSSSSEVVLAGGCKP